MTGYWLIAIDQDHRRDVENEPEWDGPADEPVWAVYRRHETGGGDGDGWDEEIKGGLTKPGAEHLAHQLGLDRNARLGD